MGNKITSKQIIELTEEYSRVKTLAELEMPLDLRYIKEILYDIGMIEMDQKINFKDIEMMYDTIIEPFN